MPTEILHLPPLYTLVGIYRLLTDPLIRQPVLDKIRHASIRGLVVGVAYAAGSWKIMSWFVRHFLVGGHRFFGLGLGTRGKVGQAVGESAGGVVRVGVGRWSIPVDLVLYTHLLILLPQLSSILRFFIYKNLRLARSRAYALTVASRGKPAEFWSQGYVEEWAQPPKLGPGALAKGGRRAQEAQWIKWILWWPSQLVIRHYLLIPLSPNLPLLAPVFTSFLRAITTAEYLHQPYFDMKGMSAEERWRWIEERKWAYRTFGFAASLIESTPIAGLFLSIPNRIGAAMWAFDLEKRQHLFSHGILKPLPPDQVGLLGSGIVSDLGANLQGAEDEIERQWSKKPPLSADHPKLERRATSYINVLTFLLIAQVVMLAADGAPELVSAREPEVDAVPSKFVSPLQFPISPRCQKEARASRLHRASPHRARMPGLPYAVLALLNVIYFACMSLNAAAPPALERLLPQPDAPHSALIVTAHPDDESMFFAPTVLALTKAGWDVSALCLSTGDAAGLGGIREQELYAAYEILGVSKDKVQVVDTPALQDGMNTAWDVSTAGKLVYARLQQSPASVVITFDGQGISGHANHIAASEACSPLHWPAQPSSTPRVYNVISPSLYAKYLGPLPGWVDLLLTDIDQYPWAKGVVAWVRPDGAAAGLRINSSPPAWLKSTRAMRAHKTQLVWYRWLWLGFSSLQWTNELVEV